jgi:hypothetical protein
LGFARSTGANIVGACDIDVPASSEHAIRDEEDLRRHIEYIHFNPVKHGHVMRAGDWPHSSIHRCIRRGIIDA